MAVFQVIRLKTVEEGYQEKDFRLLPESALKACWWNVRNDLGAPQAPRTNGHSCDFQDWNLLWDKDVTAAEQRPAASTQERRSGPWEDSLSRQTDKGRNWDRWGGGCL